MEVSGQPYHKGRLGPFCPYCDEQLRPGEDTCRDWRCISAHLETVRAMAAGDRGDMDGWRRHNKRREQLIAQRLAEKVVGLELATEPGLDR